MLDQESDLGFKILDLILECSIDQLVELGLELDAIIALLRRGHLIVHEDLIVVFVDGIQGCGSEVIHVLNKHFYSRHLLNQHAKGKHIVVKVLSVCLHLVILRELDHLVDIFVVLQQIFLLIFYFNFKALHFALSMVYYILKRNEVLFNVSVEFFNLIMIFGDFFEERLTDHVS